MGSRVRRRGGRPSVHMLFQHVLKPRRWILDDRRWTIEDGVDAIFTDILTRVLFLIILLIILVVSNNTSDNTCFFNTLKYKVLKLLSPTLGKWVQECARAGGRPSVHMLFQHVLNPDDGFWTIDDRRWS